MNLPQNHHLEGEIPEYKDVEEDDSAEQVMNVPLVLCYGGAVDTTTRAHLHVDPYTQTSNTEMRSLHSLHNYEKKLNEVSSCLAHDVIEGIVVHEAGTQDGVGEGEPVKAGKGEPEENAEEEHVDLTLHDQPPVRPRDQKISKESASL